MRYQGRTRDPYEAIQHKIVTNPHNSPCSVDPQTFLSESGDRTGVKTSL
jgi:hypothetical protein